MRTLAIVAILTSAASAQMCPGDTDGSRSVTVNEIVATVGAALDGCRATGDACSRSFFAPPNGKACAFDGETNDRCELVRTRAAFFREPTTGFLAVVLRDGDRGLYIAAEPKTPFSAEIFAVSLDNRTYADGDGDVYLSGDGLRLDVRLGPKSREDLLTLVLGDCVMRHFTGEFLAEVIATP